MFSKLVLVLFIFLGLSSSIYADDSVFPYQYFETELEPPIAEKVVTPTTNHESLYYNPNSRTFDVVGINSENGNNNNTFHCEKNNPISTKNNYLLILNTPYFFDTHEYCLCAAATLTMSEPELPTWFTLDHYSMRVIQVWNRIAFHTFESCHAY